MYSIATIQNVFHRQQYILYSIATIQVVFTAVDTPVKMFDFKIFQISIFKMSWQVLTSTRPSIF